MGRVASRAAGSGRRPASVRTSAVGGGPAGKQLGAAQQCRRCAHTCRGSPRNPASEEAPSSERSVAPLLGGCPDGGDRAADDTASVSRVCLTSADRLRLQVSRFGDPAVLRSHASRLNGVWQAAHASDTHQLPFNSPRTRPSAAARRSACAHRPCWFAAALRTLSVLQRLSGSRSASDTLGNLAQHLPPPPPAPAASVARRGAA